MVDGMSETIDKMKKFRSYKGNALPSRILDIVENMRIESPDARADASMVDLKSQTLVASSLIEGAVVLPYRLG